MKYRKKPIVIEAEQWFGHSPVMGVGLCSILRFETHQRDWQCEHCRKFQKYHGWIKTLEGGHIVCPDDWIIKGVDGEFYPCKPNIFQKTYEKVEEGQDV